MNKFHLMALAALLAVPFAAVPYVKAADAVPQVGQAAPDFSLPSQDGTPVSLKEFRGKWVVLYFYPKDNTPGCTVEAHSFQQDLPKYDALNAVIVGVSVDSSDSHKDFCAKQGLTFKLAADTDKKVVEEYGSLKEMMGMKLASRNTFLVDPEGKIAKEWIGVKPAGHSAEVLAALGELEKK
jgi:peroxiredoxin Q/BCP